MTALHFFFHSGDELTFGSTSPLMYCERCENKSEAKGQHRPRRASRRVSALSLLPPAFLSSTRKTTFQTHTHNLHLFSITLRLLLQPTQSSHSSRALLLLQPLSLDVLLLLLLRRRCCCCLLQLELSKLTLLSSLLLRSSSQSSSFGFGLLLFRSQGEEVSLFRGEDGGFDALGRRNEAR